MGFPSPEWAGVYSRKPHTLCPLVRAAFEPRGILPGQFEGLMERIARKSMAGRRCGR
jgi:hypothetical protein